MIKYDISNVLYFFFINKNYRIPVIFHWRFLSSRKSNISLDANKNKTGEGNQMILEN